MPRLPYQSKEFLYVVESEIDFHSMGRMKQITYYGYDYEVPRSEIIRRSKENIKKKLAQSSGRIINVKVVKVWHR